MFPMHLVFDVDAGGIELYKNNKLVFRPNGSLKKTARIQLKEMLGFSPCVQVLKIFLIYPEFFYNLTPDSFILTSHFSVVFKDKMTV